MISDALHTSLLYDAVLDVEIMKIAAMKAIMYMVFFDDPRHGVRYVQWKSGDAGADNWRWMI
jgi:hypothetical protein